ncbi:unnamed protein product [Paramecium octaurelia]|uniref:Uncharacterized protein n=1 Tax=Paramecium octaurelia TaxID=43137 RepID=A0A8S1YJ76_PAROT|nr:unnamed protein product [Paramecium octaurelia]
MNAQNKQVTKVKILIQNVVQMVIVFILNNINKKCTLVSKNGQYVNLTRKTLNGQFVTQQSIHFNTYQIIGRRNDDGGYLITWDDNSKQIQIRRYQEQ